MWAALGTNLKMTEDDYGVPIYFSVKNAKFSTLDSIKLTVKDTINGTEKFSKTISNLSGNIFQLYLTAAESALLPIGQYIYSLDWYCNEVFLCNLVAASSLIVTEKA